ncbi:CapA family protein [Alicyclobacillus sp. SO9]|uniref:CapA family protein n=1 Tax=Alicyclobacillus sp. SO9 TaxID=2665646 RepID=UPI0018E71242|nr:CapA family protein [Alicyclobacillus sp. SO9]QQE78884.1 CapA family protein [Alicyclobacillus sp. SO9]
MPRTLRIAAVGDILMWGSQIQAARDTAQGSYLFDPMFAKAAPLLRQANLTIGNLETTLSGREQVYQKRNPKTGYPRFNCPDELAYTLRRVGFNVLTTANNHCMDRGESGLRRTLNVLDKAGIQHTGTFRSKAESQKQLIYNANGFRIGILSYTYGTNYIPVPSGKPWLVNRIHQQRMIQDLNALHGRCDAVVVSLHFGQEFYRYPNQRQKQIVRTLFYHGADIILGAHPHVLQPASIQTVTDKWGRTKRRFAIYSLGNFISDRMMGNRYADIGVIVRLTLEKGADGTVNLRRIAYAPTWVQKRSIAGPGKYRVIPTAPYAKSELALRRIHLNTLRHLRGKVK